jgi:hypothetical protein
MGFLCLNKEVKKSVSQTDLVKQEFLRDIGLNMVNNINTEVKLCKEIFLSPLYYVQGANGLYSGLTSSLTGCTSGITGVYNLTYTPEVDLNFVITGGTDYTGYTGDFCFKMFRDEFFNPVTNTGTFVNGSEFLDYCVTFSAITATTVTKKLMEGSLPKTWAQYLIRPYYKFKSKECNPNATYNSWENTVQFNVYQSYSDYYFMTVTDPPTPILAPPPGPVRPEYSLITDRLYVNGVTGPRGTQAIGGNLNYFLLTAMPANGQIMLLLNGIQLTQGYDFNLITNSFSVPPTVEITGVNIKSTDWLLATYIAESSNPLTTNYGTYFIDTIILDSFTSLTTPTYRTSGDNSLNYNPSTTNYEFFTSLPIDPTYSLIVTVNGVKLADDLQYFKSTTFDGRIIFDKNNTSFSVGDVISVLASSKPNGSDNNDYGSLSTNQFTVNWAVPTTFTNSSVTGRFIIEAFNNDTGVKTNQLFLDYSPSISNYEVVLNSLSLNVNYRFRVTFEATYTGYLNNKVITCSYSEGFFNTTSAYINNTY